MKRQANSYSQQRPIKGSSSGQYNLNFIDETNDLAAYCNGELPELQQLINRHFETVTWGDYSNAKNHFVPAMNLCESHLFEVNVGQKGQKLSSNKSNIQRQKNHKQRGKTNLMSDKTNFMSDHCSVCTEYFREKQEIKVLPCHHCFHKSCIKPWFEVNSKCPNCRFDLYEGKSQ